MQTLSETCAYSVVGGGLAAILFNDTLFGGRTKVRNMLLYTIFFVLCYLAIPAPPDNYYGVLELPVGVDKYFIITQYRVLAKKYHPDKTDPDDEYAEERFMKFKKAYDVLSNDQMRSYYMRFGDFNETGELTEKDILIYLVLAVVSYILLFSICYACTFAPCVRGARDTVFFFSMVLAAFEMYLRFVDEESLFSSIWGLKYYVSFEHMKIFRGLFPALLVFSMIKAGTCYISVDDTNLKLLRGILATNRALIERSNEIVRIANYFRSLSAANASLRALEPPPNEVKVRSSKKAANDMKAERKKLQEMLKEHNVPDSAIDTLFGLQNFKEYVDETKPHDVDGSDVIHNTSEDHEKRMEDSRNKEWTNLINMLSSAQRDQFVRTMNIVVQREAAAETTNLIAYFFGMKQLFILAIISVGYLISQYWNTALRIFEEGADFY